MHGATDRRPVATPLPRWQVEVDGVLLQPLVALGELGDAVVALGRGGHRRGQPGGAGGRTHRRRGDRTGELGLPLGEIGPRQLEVVGDGAVDRLGDTVEHAGAVTEPAALGEHGCARRSRRPLLRIDLLGLAVQRHDEVVHRSRAGDVEEPPALGVAHLLVERLVRLEVVVVALGQHPAVVRPDDRERRLAGGLGRQPADDRDRELQALGRMHRHHPHGVVVALGQDRVARPALGRLVRRPAQVPPDATPAGVGPRSCLVDDVAHATPHVAGVRSTERRLQQAPVDDDAVEQLGRGRPADVPGDRGDVGDGLTDRVIVHSLRRRGEQPPAAARLPPVVQLAVAAPVQRAAQRGHEGQRVGGIGRRSQGEHQRADLRRDVDDGGVLGPVGDGQPGQHRLEHRQRRACREQYGDVVGPAGAQPSLAVAHRPRLAQGRDHGGADGLGLQPAQRIGVDVVVHVGAEDVDRAVVPRGRPAAVQRAVGGLHVGLLLDDVAEDPVDPRDDGVGRAEVRREHLALGVELAGRGEVHGDVRPTEAVDRLLRVADDEEASGHRPQPGDVVGGLVGREGGEADGDLQLDRIGVLELVEQDAAVALVQPGAHVGSHRQQAAGEDEQVVELERAGR